MGQSVRKGASIDRDPARAAQELFEAIDQPDPSLIVFYCSPEYDLDVLGAELKKRFGDAPMMGCTTAGEITPQGYIHGSITGVSIADPDFEVVLRRIGSLGEFELGSGQHTVADMINELGATGEPPTGSNAFGFLLVDGLSMQEEAVVASLYRGMGDIPLFGGSAGDEQNFGRTFVFHDGAFHGESAVFALVRTSHPFVVFKTQHFVSSQRKMVVTRADSSRRLVMEINGRPAGLEYARMVGLEKDELTPLIFATYPVVVRIGGTYFVRSIQKVNDDGSLTFFCAIDEGIVLTVAQGVDLVDNLETAFRDVREQIGEPQLVLGCDCILRNLELDREGLTERVGAILANNNVIGFATYGEQYNAMHVNQTFTGVAIGKKVA